MDLLNTPELRRAAEQYIQETAAQSDMDEDIIPPEKCPSLSGTNTSRDFDCNICLDLVQDPVVTFCGHLYCWPCLYRWINSRDENGDRKQSQCPVCKTEVSQKTLIPLYGRGQTSDYSQNSVNILNIPRRPTMCTETSRSYPVGNPRYTQQPSEFVHRVSSRMFGETQLVDPMIGMLGEMLYARMSGNSETTLYPYPNSYHLADSSSPRLRRHVMQADLSLSRVCLFLFCCVILCLLLF
ncbi:E3 ubiquitin-protein ligase RMA1H1-like isoform X1 [Primulina eburnea]|uniref:E3 ubiquitin-protein ligase RMA1H1-like isoform X1 n=2 Tax=Primulina eburnea TaxID=1245227 RepID=UPI003C6CA618